MTAVQDFIRQRPVLVYYVLTFGISWSLVLLVLGPGGFLGTSDTIVTSGPLSLAGPTAAGLLLTWVVGGRAGFAELRSRLGRWRVPARWYAVALLTAPLLKAATIVGLLVASVEFNPAIVTEGDKVIVLLGGISSGIFVAIFEEIGWTGFAMPRLKLRCSVLTTGLLMGFLWGLWHFPMFAGSTDSSETIPPVLYVALLLFSWLPPYRVLMVWVYDRTGSVLLAMVMHFPIVVMSVVLADDDMPGDVMAISLLAMGALLWLTVGAVALANGRRFLAKPADPTVPASAIGRAGGLPSAS